EFPGPFKYEGEMNWPAPVALGPVGHLAAEQDDHRRLLVWQPGQARARRKSSRLGPLGDGLAGLAFSPDGRYIAAATP
ncbi:hypothetical protein RSW84_30700, partial [Escherichia coli]|uniref:hypothetical protein n=1 Tax=Escherichia coli TaxID=562 RepID=UPI0028DE70A8